MRTEGALDHVMKRLRESLEWYDDAKRNGGPVRMAESVEWVISSARFAILVEDYEDRRPDVPAEPVDEPATTAEVAANLFEMAEMEALVTTKSTGDAVRERIAWNREVADELQRLLDDEATL